MLKPFNMQLFAEPGEPGKQTEPDTPSAGKTFSEDYVHILRNESKGYRTKAQGYEAAIRSTLGIQDGEEIGDFSARLSAFKQSAESVGSTKLQEADRKIVLSELRALEGYNHKLLGKLIDFESIKVDEKGNVAGLTEAAEAAAKENPEVLKRPPIFSRGTQGPNQNMETNNEKANAALRAAFGKE